jgi:hypothetical protein
VIAGAFVDLLVGLDLAGAFLIGAIAALAVVLWRIHFGPRKEEHAHRPIPPGHADELDAISQTEHRPR